MRHSSENPTAVSSELGVVALPFVPVPPTLEAVLGYGHDQRFVAFYWAAAEGVLCYTDGLHAVCGSGMTNPTGWHLYVTHPRVAKPLESLNVYGEEAAHALILDRAQRRMYTATIQGARDVLAGRHIDNLAPFDMPIEIRREFFAPADMPAQPIESDGMSMEAIYARAEKRRAAEREMAEWLDQSPPRDTREKQA
jgi:hypothetical protein